MPLGIPLIFVTFGLIWFIEEAISLRRILQSRSWLTTTGRVVRSSVTAVSLTNRYRETQPHIVYRYMVGGAEFQGDRIGVAGGTYSFFPRGRFPINDQLPVGAEVRVWYDPNKPERSALDIESDIGAYGRPAIAIGVVLLGLLMLFLQWFLQ